MHYRVLESGAQRKFAVTFDKGDEVLESLSQFAKEHRLGACRVTGLGAFCYAMLGQFDWERKHYKPVPIEERVEVLSLVGNMMPREANPELDVHVSVVKSNGSVCGGHLLEGYVKPRFEVTVEEGCVETSIAQACTTACNSNVA